MGTTSTRSFPSPSRCTTTMMTTTARRSTVVPMVRHTTVKALVAPLGAGTLHGAAILEAATGRTR